jgi:hypothetical protein
MRKIIAPALLFLLLAAAASLTVAAAGNQRAATARNQRAPAGADRVIPGARQKAPPNGDQQETEAATPSVPQGWKVVKDSKGNCQIAVPENWFISDENSGSAVFRDPTTGIAVVTSQPGQAFKPMPESLIRLLDIPKNRLFENTARRTFYQDRVARGPDDTSSYCAMVPAKNGTCSARVAFAQGVPEDVVKKIVLSLSPVTKE